MLEVLFAAVYLLSAQIDPSVLREDDSESTDYSAELPRIPGTAPADALATFELIDGYRLDQVAAEPLVTDPVAMAFDEYGRLFVAEMRGYSELRDQIMGVIRLLEDTDGDGTYDKSSIYADGLAWPTAVICYDGGIFVGAAPDILYIKDTDGDGVADEQEVVFTGFGLKNVQGLINSFRWSVDNRIHGATSSSGGEITKAGDSESKPLSLNGRDFSFDPRTLELRAESGGAQHGMSFDRWGNKFVCSNSDHIQQVLYEDRYAARNPYLAAPPARVSIAEDGPAAEVFRISPVEPWRIVRTRLRVGGMVTGPIEGGGRAAGYFTGATGVTIYKGDAMPELLDMAFIGDVGGNLVHRKKIDRSTFPFKASRVDEGTEFLRSRDIWFRPAQFDNGPDGALYIADMCREVIEHPASLPPMIKKHLDLNSGNDRGRIYRVVPEGFEQPAIPRLGDLSSEELVPYIDHANAWHRETAARLLYERADRFSGELHSTREDRYSREVVLGLAELLKPEHLPEARIVALYLLEDSYRILNLSMAQIMNGTFIEPLSEEEAILIHESLMDMASDPNKEVRRNFARFAEDAMSILVWHGTGQSYEPRMDWSSFASESNGPDKMQQAFSMAGGPAVADQLGTLVASSPDETYVQFAARTISPFYFGDVLRNIAARADVQDSAAGRAFIADIAHYMGMSGGGKNMLSFLETLRDKTPYVGRKSDGTPFKGNYAAVAVLVQTNFIKGLSEGGHAEMAEKLMEDNADLASAFASTIRAAESLARSNKGKPYYRAEAIDLWARHDINVKGLTEILDDSEAHDVHASVVDALRNHGPNDSVKVLLDRLDNFTPKLREAALAAMAGRPAWALALLDAIDAGTLPRTTIDSVRADVLKGHADEAVRARAAAVLGETGSRDPAEVAAKLAAILALTPDATRGQVIFAENCTPCHKVGDLGYTLGPDLATVAEGGREKIISNILDPNAEVNPQYVNYIIETKDWESYSGVITSESASSIHLQRAHGETDQILRHDIESIKSTGRTIMPEDFDVTLGEQALADVSLYLSTLGR